GKGPEELGAIGKAFRAKYGHLTFVSSYNTSVKTPKGGADGPSPGEADRLWLASVLEHVTGGRVGHQLKMATQYGDLNQTFNPESDGFDTSKAEKRLGMEDAWLQDSWAFEGGRDSVAKDKFESPDAEPGLKHKLLGSQAANHVADTRTELQRILDTDRDLLKTGHPEAWRRYDGAKKAYEAAVNRRAEERSADAKTTRALVDKLTKLGLGSMGLGLDPISAALAGKVLGIGAEGLAGGDVTAQDFRNGAVGGVFGGALKTYIGNETNDYFGSEHGYGENGKLSDAAELAKKDSKVDDVIGAVTGKVVDSSVKTTMSVSSSREDNAKAELKNKLWTDAGSLLTALGGIGINEARDNDNAIHADDVDGRVAGEAKGTDWAKGMIDKAYVDYLKKSSGTGALQDAETQRSQKNKAEKKLGVDLGHTLDDQGHRDQLSTEQKLQELLDNGALDPGRLIQLAFEAQDKKVTTETPEGKNDNTAPNL
ncbi:MAG: hypothetical protein AB8H79_02035, partial [Myxococcota bacterium]